MKNKTELDPIFETKDCEDSARIWFELLLVVAIGACIAVVLIIAVLYTSNHLPKTLKQWQIFALAVSFMTVFFVSVSMLVRKLLNK